MTSKLLGAALVALLFCPTAQAIDTWQGVKYLYSTSNQEEYAIKVELADNLKGTLVTKDGSSATSFKKVGETIEITPSEPIRYVSHPFKGIEETGEWLQVTAVSTLQKMEISDLNLETEIKETWEECYQYAVEGESVQNCEVTDTTMNKGVVIEDELQSTGLIVQDGDNVVLPIPAFDSIFVNLKSDKTASVLKAGGAFDNQGVTSWTADGKSLSVTFDDGATITYTAIQNLENVSRVIGLYEKGSQEMTVVGAFTVDEKIDAASLSKEEIAGQYSTVLASTTTFHDIVYEFNADGFGGFETNYQGQVTNNLWSWSFEDGLIEATRYSVQEGYPASTPEEVKSCATGKFQCSVYQTRSYKIIGKTENRYTMLRTLTHNFGDKEIKDLSVWVFNKL